MRRRGQISYVTDLLLSDTRRDTVKGVIDAVENETLRQGSHFVIFHVLDNAYWQSLFEAFGYHQPLLGKTSYYLTVKIHGASTHADVLTDKNKWMLMSGDIV